MRRNRQLLTTIVRGRLRPGSRGSLGLLATLGTALLSSAMQLNACEDPADAEAAVVVEEGTVADEGEAAVVEVGATTEWSARPIRRREVGDQAAFVRQSSDAFENPDARGSLEIKYYFEVPEPLAAAVSLDRHQGASVPQRIELDDPAMLGDLAERFPLDFSNSSTASETGSGTEAQWLDYVAGDRAKLVAVLLPPLPDADKSDDAAGAHDADGAWLLVLRLKLAGDRWVVDKKVAARAIDGRELAPASPGRMRLDTWDRPLGLGSRAVFVGRLIGVLKLVDGRYAVDFYGEALHPDSDCRVWLAPPDHSLGTPQGIHFSELPVRKGEDRVATAWVLSVDYEATDGTRATIAIDYPLCRPAIMAAMSKVSDPRKPGPDLQKLLGDDLLDEFTRRIVDGSYK
ncbi:MAG: hypothetical protein K2Y37_04495 [Pirellulales bacterium]|nr:hypothetical protein [Pirellulales bacterium]